MGLLLFLLGLKAISRRVVSLFRRTRLTVTLFFGTALQLLLRALLALCGVEGRFLPPELAVQRPALDRNLVHTGLYRKAALASLLLAGKLSLGTCSLRTDTLALRLRCL
ncbi:hypothetical protein [Rhodoferax sp. TS-BS-61-7]|uniref:hypothetical protein n=1 Tax=Rhodoferax sp. TS-BS-61-7 TaxID=2094194 RepID=UPI0011B0E09E|nr:hypothetical protein [Rhodoferax sp. TS-BS-61-7]